MSFPYPTVQPNCSCLPCPITNSSLYAHTSTHLVSPSQHHHHHHHQQKYKCFDPDLNPICFYSSLTTGYITIIISLPSFHVPSSSLGTNTPLKKILYRANHVPYNMKKTTRNPFSGTWTFFLTTHPDKWTFF